MSRATRGSRYIKDVLAYSSELLSKRDLRDVSTKDILGFEVPKAANAYVPYIRCVPITTLLPLYDRLIVGIPKIEKISHVHQRLGMNLEDIFALAHAKRLVILVDVDCVECLEEMSTVVQELVDNDVPVFFAHPQEQLLALKAAETVGVDYDEGKRIGKEYTEVVEVPHLGNAPFDDLMRRKIQAGEFAIFPYPLGICSKIKPTAEYLREVIALAKKGESHEYVQALVERLYMVPHLLSAKMLNSNLSTNVGCRHLYGLEGEVGDSLPTHEPVEYFDPAKLEFIERKLRIAYSDDISLKDYAQAFDSKTTGVMRGILHKMISHEGNWEIPFTKLQELVGEYNESVGQLATRRTKKAKVLYATSDILRSNAEAIKILVAGVAEKYLGVPDKAWDCVGLPIQYRRSALNWLRDRTTGLESKLAGVSPDMIHLYHTRTCLDRLRQTPESE